MDNYSLKVLKYITKNSDKENPLSYSDINKKFKANELLDDSLEYLDKVKLINITCILKDRHRQNYYYSSVRGKKFIHQKHIDFFKSILKVIFFNIAIPIFVAYVTALLESKNYYNRNCNDTPYTQKNE